jgi:hypothetical protein
MASVRIPAAEQAADRVAVKRQPRARDGDGDYVAPALEHVGNEIDALLAVRLDPTQDGDDA